MGKGNLSRWQKWRARRSFNTIAPVLKQVSQSRWQQMADAMGPEIYSFLRAEWRFPSMWDGGNGYPPRPRSATELADHLGSDVEMTREIDWEIVDMFRSARRHDPYVDDFLTVPIDAAQEWWDRWFGWLLMPDGSHKRQRERAKPAAGPPSPPDIHDIEDERELMKHMERDHGPRLWARVEGHRRLPSDGSHRRSPRP
jgi:hypothetical protein